MTADTGKLHRHENGMEHRHFKAGSTFGGLTASAKDGSQPHYHGTVTIGGANRIKPRSGSVVWIEEDA